MVKTDHIPVTQRAKYCRLGELHSGTTDIWIVLHGYGQLAQYFIRKFQIVADAGHVVVAPEATSRFYLSNHNGRVGATWMTREDREVDIDNYVSYLDQLYETLVVPQRVRVTLVGFSQGAATASRWVAHGKSRIDRLLLWSGIFPPDMNINQARTVFKNIEVFNIYGDNDPFLKEEKVQEQQSIVDELAIECQNIEFEGVHDIDRATLKVFI